MIALAKFGHEDNCTPGKMNFDGTRDEIIQQANKFVETGYRNSTWVSVDLGDALYIARNVHGKSVGQTNHD